MRDDDSDLVWSSDQGDLRGSGGEGSAPTPKTSGQRRPSRRKNGKGMSPPGPSGRVRREVAGRRGKAVTTVTGVPDGDQALRRLAKALKKRCGVGGTAKNGTIELQGDHRDVVLETLKKAGYDAVSAGG